LFYLCQFFANLGAPTTSTGMPQPSPTLIIPETLPSSSNDIVTRKNFPETWLFDCVDK